ncbi:MAG TPA: ABC transporter permease [Pseudolysinimonas sp.]|nr:ABC transporter permease [Pseudolysinimonas sp.]
MTGSTTVQARTFTGTVVGAVRAAAGRLGGFAIGLIIALGIEIAIFASRSPYFFSVINLTNIGRGMAIVGIVAVGATIVMIAGGFDLSVGSVMAASGMTAAWAMNAGLGIVSAILLALALGLTVGLLNGTIVAYMRINPLIATLGTLGIVRGLAFVVSGGQEIVVSDMAFVELGTQEVLGIPISVLVMLGVFVFFGWRMPRTRFGRYTYAIGSNARAAKLAGIPVARWQLAFYGTAGLLAALGGLVTVARVGSAQPTANLSAELDVITAVILGGTSLAGGRGRLFGTFLGLLVIAVLNNGLVLADVPTYWQQVVKGIVLLTAVFADEIRRSRREEG